jgi:hypothetical protein
MLRVILVAALAAAATGRCHADPVAYFPNYTREGKARGMFDGMAPWYAEALRVMKEPPLWPAKPGIEVYRFLIMPTWGNPIAVRAVAINGGYKLFSRRLSGQGGYDIGKLDEQREVALSHEDSDELQKRIAALKLFELTREEETVGSDGDEWVLEGVSSGKYHVIHRWCASRYNPGKRGLKPFVDLCDFLISKSGLSKRPTNRGLELLPETK